MNMPHVGHSWLKTKPGSYKKVCDRYYQFSKDLVSHHPDLHDVMVIGNQAQNIIEAFGIWENASHAASLEDSQDFADLMADIADDLAEPYHRNDLELLYRMNPKP
jgi:hypothetical protein